MPETESISPASGNPRQALVLGAVVLLIALAGLIAWFAIKGLKPRATPIGDILADLRSYDGKVVTIEGEASSPMNLLLLKYYEVSDDSGSIMVVTERGLPAVGEEVRVDGVVHEVFNLGGVNYTVIMEPASRE